MPARTLRGTSAALVVALSFAGSALAADFPTKDVRMVVA